MLPLKNNMGTVKNHNSQRTLGGKILFHKRTDKAGPHKNSGPHQTATHLEQVIFPLSLTAHRCCELDHNFVQLEDRECIVSSTGLISSPLASFLGQDYHSFRPIIGASSLTYTSQSSDTGWQVLQIHILTEDLHVNIVGSLQILPLKYVSSLKLYSYYTPIAPISDLVPIFCSNLDKCNLVPLT